MALSLECVYCVICFCVDSLNVSSLHLTFNSEEEQELLHEEGYLGMSNHFLVVQLHCHDAGRIGVQYHWENPGYANFDEFLMELKQSKRKSIRQVIVC